MRNNETIKTYYFFGGTSEGPADLSAIAECTESDAKTMVTLNSRIHSYSETPPWWLTRFDDHTGKMITFFDTCSHA